MKQDEIERRLKLAEALAEHSFADRALLLEAVTHRSYANESPENITDNDRLEYLGDAVLDLLVAEELFKRFPDLMAGELTKLRASLVNEETLAEIGHEHDLGSMLFLGVGEKRTGGEGKASVLADGYESLLGATYLDGGLDAARRMVLRDIGSRVEDHLMKMSERDPKSYLQELCAKKHRKHPIYKRVGRTGPDHDACFEVECHIGDRIYGRGAGRNIKNAEQNAAREALEKLIQNKKNEGERE